MGWTLAAAAIAAAASAYSADRAARSKKAPAFGGAEGGKQVQIPNLFPSSAGGSYLQQRPPLSERISGGAGTTPAYQHSPMMSEMDKYQMMQMANTKGK